MFISVKKEEGDITMCVEDSGIGVKNLLADPTDIVHHGGYFTVRPEEVETATRDWLSENDFPEADDVVICKDSKDKLRNIFKRFNHPDSDGDYPSVVLVDDSHEKLVTAACEIAEEDPSMQEALGRRRC